MDIHSRSRETSILGLIFLSHMYTVFSVCPHSSNRRRDERPGLWQDRSTNDDRERRKTMSSSNVVAQKGDQEVSQPETRGDVIEEREASAKASASVRDSLYSNPSYLCTICLSLSLYFPSLILLTSAFIARDEPPRPPLIDIPLSRLV